MNPADLESILQYDPVSEALRSEIRELERKLAIANQKLFYNESDSPGIEYSIYDDPKVINLSHIDNQITLTLVGQAKITDETIRRHVIVKARTTEGKIIEYGYYISHQSMQSVDKEHAMRIAQLLSETSARNIAGIR